MKYFLAWFVLFCTTSLFYVHGELDSCEPGQILCRDRESCINGNWVCDGGIDCNDGSDEDPNVCEEIERKRISCSGGNIPNLMGHCASISEVCSVYNDIPLFCLQGVRRNEPSQTENSEPKNSCNQDKKLEDLLVHLATSFNETLKIQNYSTGCPPLYVNIDGKCIALFSVAQVTWNEAKQFCESISGSLAIVNKIQDYVALLTYLKLQEVETNFWIGGYYNETNSTSSSSWMWLNQTDIKMGAPYWGLLTHLPQNTNCSKPGLLADCKYTLAPQENRDGFCLALDSKFHYYFSDQNCKEKRSPLCVLTEMLIQNN